ncbi:AraC family transcriptional regulator [Paenibacillus yonginensis]|uniref:AraC family transcriptional regulator n=1 Tax=Paenibacillus yonginensis TaxID=1462996 RepID=A0A1B1MYS1_9BACL|nr:AraC family transcriptional regulator [Paenibacillus yonginensis]ANS74334.1 AraC family transcriptional regulator [Paenibacillus yonginensis]
MDTIRKIDGFTSQKLIVLPDDILNKISKHPLVAPLYVTDTGYFPEAKYHYRERPDGIGAYILIYCAGGEGWIQLQEGRKQWLRKGFAAVIPAGAGHRYASSEDHPWSIYWWHMKGEQAAVFFEDFDKQPEPLLLGAQQNANVVRLFEEGYEILQKGYSLNHMIYVSQLAAYLAVMLRLPQLLSADSNRQPGNKGNMDGTIRYMSEHLEGRLTLAELASQANLSVPHLTHRFKQATGYSPVDYYLRLKIQRACQMLDLTDQSIKEISHRLGFQDPYYFSRLFKKIMGKPPTEYRETRKG